MLKILIEKEIREIISSPKFMYTFIVCLILILLSFYSGASNHKLNLAHYEAAQAENLRSFEGIKEWYRVQDNRIFLPPQALATLVSGVSNDIGRTIDVETRGEVIADDSRYNEEPAYAYFRFMDLEFIFIVVLALFAIMLGYDAISGEKEKGTLKLCLSNAIPRTTFLIGKFIGSFAVLSVSLIVTIGLGCLLLPAMGVHLSSQEWTRLALIVLAGLLYFGLFLAMSVMVSSFTQRTSTSFLVLLIIWISSTLILSRVAVLVSGRAVDVPTVDQIGYQKAMYATEQWKSFVKALDSYKAIDSDNMDEVMANFNRFMDSLSNAREEKLSLNRSKLNEQRYNKELERSGIAFALSRISPASSLTLATSELAGTSPHLKDKFYQQAKDYQTTFKEFLTEKTGMNVDGGMIMITEDGSDEEKEPIDPTEIPQFVFQNDSLSDSFRKALPDFALLILFNCIFIAGAFISFNRYDAR